MATSKKNQKSENQQMGRSREKAPKKISVTLVTDEQKTFKLSPLSTAQNLLSQAEVDHDGAEIRVNNKPAKLSRVLKDGDVVTVLDSVEGG